MNSSDIDVLCTGIVVADHVCRPVERVPRPGELVLTERMDLTVGGNAANVSVNLAKLGRAAHLVGAVGDDVFGRHIRTTLADAGVCCDGLREVPGRDTSGTLVINARGEDRRFIHSIGANTEFTGEEISPKLIAQARILYLGGYLLYDELAAEHVAAAFQTARAANVTTVLDVVVPGDGEYAPRLEPVLPWTDFFLPNDDEAAAITRERDPFVQAERFLQMGAGTAVITCGDGGAVLLSASERLRCGRHAAEFVDGTGSGDAFAAGFMHGLLDGCDMRNALRYGSALGAACVQSAGATTGAMTAEELEAFCAAHELDVEELGRG